MNTEMLRASSCEPRAWYTDAKLLARSSWLAAQFLLALAIQAQESHIPLNDGWQFQQVGKEQWYSAEVPGVVQTDLLRHGLIPDFYKGSNIDSVQWIENEDWIYKRTILANDSLLKHGHVDLVFKGLDTFAEVYLNDSLLGKADNMFRTWEWPIKELLKPGSNELKVIFRSPIKEGAKLRDAYGIQLPHDNDPSGVSPYIRKAAYQFGWDFCPRLVTSGIWQGVELRCWSRAMLDHVHYFSGSNGDSVEMTFATTVIADTSSQLVVVARMDGVEMARSEQEAALGLNHFYPSWHQAKPKFWFPNGMGEQHLYLATVEVRQGGDVIARAEQRIGLRQVELDTKADENGNRFLFKVNGQPAFVKGCNLVPPSLLLSGKYDSEWLKLVREMKRSGMNMTRVWAGGVYPPDVFFEACDTAGILVWQDFMFGGIPSDGQILSQSMSVELDEQIQRLRNHPSLALWCGNNELQVAWNHWGWQDRYGLHGLDSARVAQSLARLFEVQIPFHHIQGQATVDYTPTSPLSNWGNAEGLKNGDLHYWGVWHGDSAFSSFKNNVGRFVSEYGFQSYPDSALLSHYIDPKELYLGSPAMKRMQRSYKTDKPIWDAIKRELDLEPKTLGEFIEASQEVQAKAYRMAIEAHMAAQPHCMGTLFWQLNDCWPGPSWSLIDFEGKWKPGMYEVQRLYAK